MILTDAGPLVAIMDRGAIFLKSSLSSLAKAIPRVNRIERVICLAECRALTCPNSCPNTVANSASLLSIAISPRVI